MGASERQTCSARADQQWVADLKSEDHTKERALADLRAALITGLSRAFRQPNGGMLLIEDAVQEALIRIVDRIDTYRGDSRFTTWAMSIGTRAILSQLRRAHWSDVSLEAMVAAGIVRPPAVVPAHEKNLDRMRLWETVRLAIDHDLTERQRQALQADLAGVPPDVIAERTGSNRNAVYKLIHDARVRLRRVILAEGWTEQSVRTLLRDLDQ